VADRRRHLGATIFLQYQRFVLRLDGTLTRTALQVARHLTNWLVVALLSEGGFKYASARSGRTEPEWTVKATATGA
jgi:hypothetical protein